MKNFKKILLAFISSWLLTYNYLWFIGFKFDGANKRYNWLTDYKLYVSKETDRTIIQQYTRAFIRLPYNFFTRSKEFIKPILMFLIIFLVAILILFKLDSIKSYITAKKSNSKSERIKKLEEEVKELKEQKK